MKAYRELFPICRHTVYLNNAGVAPPPVTVRAEATKWLHDLEEHGLTDDDRWEAMADRVRADAARLVGASADEIAFVRNTSHGLGLVAEGLDWRPGDEVAVAASIEYPSNVYPWLHLGDRGVRIREIAVDTAVGGVTPQAVADALTAKTRLVAVSAVQYASGHRTDLHAIGRLCADRDMLFLVDGIQQVGAYPIDVKAARIHFLSADSHKWMLGLPGIGILYVDQAVSRLVRPVLVGWKSSVQAFNFDAAHFVLPANARKFEEGSPAYPMIAGMGAGIRLLHEAGISAVADHIADLQRHLETEAIARGLVTHAGPAPENRAGILSLATVEDAAACVRRCAARGIKVSLRRGRVRVAPHLFNDGRDIDALLEALASS